MMRHVINHMFGTAGVTLVLYYVVLAPEDYVLSMSYSAMYGQ